MQCLPVTMAAPSSPTKASLYGAILFTLQQTRWLPVSKATLIFIFTMFMVSCKVSFLILIHTHPHLPDWGTWTHRLGYLGKDSCNWGWELGAGQEVHAWRRA